MTTAQAEPPEAVRAAEGKTAEPGLARPREDFPPMAVLVAGPQAAPARQEERARQGAKSRWREQRREAAPPPGAGPREDRQDRGEKAALRNLVEVV